MALWGRVLQVDGDGQRHALCPFKLVARCPEPLIVYAGGCPQTGQMPFGRESANHDRADLDAADGGLPSQQDAAEVGLPSQQVAAEVGLLGLLHAPDGGLPSQPLVPGEECLA